MPTLDFKGKPFVYSHHLSVPYRELVVDAKKSFVAKGEEPSLDDNLIIHGDNLEALKALLPRYAGAVDLVCIDPPYNTGNEGWAYNDAVNSPLMKEWLGKVVDKEDLERHDKWLCMMWPRLQLLRELMSDRGSLWICCDDNELSRLKAIADEIFGETNFVAALIWQKVYSPKSTAAGFSEDHDYILVYARNRSSWNPQLLERTDEMEARYINPDKDSRGPWKPGDLSARNYYSEGTYPITTPSGRVIDGPPTGNYWRVSKKRLQELDADKRIWWGESGSNIPAIKRFLSEVKPGRVPQTIWFHEEVGHNQEAKQELVGMMGFSDSESVFITPKPKRLIERILALAGGDDILVLDSFAGSGTTAHAVASANAKDGGARRFILIECEDYANTLTAERVRRALEGYKVTENKKEELLRTKLNLSTLGNFKSVLEQAAAIEQRDAPKFSGFRRESKDGYFVLYGESQGSGTVQGLGGSFTYCTLGAPIDLERFFDGKSAPDWEQVARYVAYTATGQSLAKAPKKPGKDWFVGETGGYRLHLIYEPDVEFMRSNKAALDMGLAERISKCAEGKPVLVYAAAKFMGQKDLSSLGVTFCQLPYAIHRILGDGPNEA